MQMSDGNDEKAFRLDAIDESVREAGNKGAAEMRSEWTAALRGGSQSLVCARSTAAMKSKPRFSAWPS